MTILQDNTAIVSDLVAGGQQSDVSMMIGVGVNKDSDAVFFMYRGDDQEPVALTIPTSGKPLTRLGNIKVTGINVAEDVGTFKSTKLNLFLTTNSGTVILVTSGLTTLWSQCVLTGLMGAFQVGSGGLAGFLIIFFGGAQNFNICLYALFIMSGISIISSYFILKIKRMSII